uniref:VWFC domain-containing protein n=1 Tax=Glossina brevipalpis TaxID=37001 RepID=A0A1A9X1X3_9MUSC
MYNLLVFVINLIYNAKVVISASSSLVPGGHCRDYNGKLYETGMHYMPGPDSCRLCICDSGLPKACKMVLCEAFTKCKSFQTVGSVNRLRQRKIRARESRQNAEDQRSIVGSIGYIAGNMGYMEGNLSSMDYSYGGTATHYPLWKPPSGYFPRGEAPPPYEEAVAISQAEALSAQCAAAAAAAAAAVATQRPVNAVELQSSVDINRRPQAAATMQQLQHLQSHQTSLVPQQTSQHSASQSHQASAHNVMPIHHVLGAPQSHQQNQNHQITQSTTNLINININSGGNITTIATGENHQPPYSLQNEQNTNNMVQEQRPHASATQQNPQQVINTSNSNTNDNGDQLHLAQSNSICVQTVTTQPNIQQQYQQATGGQAVSSSNVSNPVGISASGKGIAAAECGYKNCHLNTNVTTTATATSTSARRTQRLPEPLQQYVVDVEVNVGNTTGSGYHSLPPCTANPANEGEFELIASPTQFANDSQMTNVLSTQAINSLIPTNNVVDVATNNTGADVNSQLLNTSHHTLPTHNTQTVKSLAPLPSNTATITKTPSSSRRYHRTMPRYYTAADPLTNRDNQSTANNATSNTSKSSKQMESKQTPNTNSANSVATAINSNSAKKPTCQCPIQHVPMSYMGSTHLNSQNVTNNAFFTVLSNKLNTGTVSRISNTNNNTSSLPYSSQRLNKTLQNHLTNTTTENNVSNTNSNSKRGTLQSHCNYESKIATISTGELVNSTTSNNTGSAHHHHSHHNHHHGHHSSSSLLPPPQHHDDSSPLVMGRVTKRSSSNSSDRFRSASSGSTRNPVNEAAAGIAGAYLNSKVSKFSTYTLLSRFSTYST